MGYKGLTEVLQYRTLKVLNGIEIRIMFNFLPGPPHIYIPHPPNLGQTRTARLVALYKVAWELGPYIILVITLAMYGTEEEQCIPGSSTSLAYSSLWLESCTVIPFHYFHVY